MNQAACYKKLSCRTCTQTSLLQQKWGRWQVSFILNMHIDLNKWCSHRNTELNMKKAFLLCYVDSTGPEEEYIVVLVETSAWLKVPFCLSASFLIEIYSSFTRYSDVWFKHLNKIDQEVPVYIFLRCLVPCIKIIYLFSHYKCFAQCLCKCGDASNYQI